MKVLKDFVPLFTAGIFFIGFLALLLTGFAYMLNPIEKDIARLEAGQAKLEDKLDQVLFELKGHSHKPSKQAKK